MIKNNRLAIRQIEALASPVKTSIIGALRQQGPLGISRISELIHRKASAVTYHVRQLEQLELVKGEGERTKNGRLYSTTKNGLAVEDWGDSEEIRSAVRKSGKAVMRAATRDLLKGHDSPAGPEREKIVLSRKQVRLNPEHYEKLIDFLKEAQALNSDDGEWYSLTFLLTPV